MIFNLTKEQLEEKKAIYTATEIAQQPVTWKKTIQQIQELKEEIQAFLSLVMRRGDYDIVLCGAGTSEFVGNSLYSYLNKKTNYKCKSYGTTDIVATPENYLSAKKPTLLISFARSGNSPESIGAVDAANTVCENLYHLFITCNRNGALALRAEEQENCYAINLTDETHDQSFAMTSSFSNMLLACLLSFELDHLDEIAQSFDSLISSAAHFLEKDYGFAQSIVQEYDFNRIVYLGTNTCKGIAQESALKMLELTSGKVATMYDTPLGFRHGPKSIIDDHTLTIIYLSDDEYAYKYELDLIKEMSVQRKGNKIVAISNQYRSEVKELTDYYYAFDIEARNNVELGLLYILVAQCIAFFKSLSYEITPDNPCVSGEVNRVVKGVILYPYIK